MPMTDVPVKTSLGSQKRLMGVPLVRVNCMVIVHRVVTSYSPVCLMSCSWKVGAKTLFSMAMLNMYPAWQPDTLSIKKGVKDVGAVSSAQGKTSTFGIIIGRDGISELHLHPS